MGKRITIKGLGKGRGAVLKRLATRVGELPDKMDAAVIRGLQSATQRGIGEVVHQIDSTKPYAPNDVGTLRSSVRGLNRPTGGELRVEAPHAGPIEYGTRPYSPPIAPLAEWAIRKGLAQDEKQAKSIAFGIRKKASVKGFAPKHYFRRAMQVVRKTIIPAEVERELEKVS